MERFNFISSGELRESLISDFNEFEKCLEIEAWVAVHVLAGSIIEAVLIDHLISTKEEGNQDKFFEMSLGQIIKECKDQHALSKDLIKLSEVINDYRNLIHPGRKKRLKKIPDKDNSIVVKGLLNMIIKEIAEKRLKSPRRTAEQLMEKIRIDEDAASLMKHLIADTQDDEVIKLLSTIIPKEIERLDSDIFDEIQTTLHYSACYRTIFNQSNAATKKVISEMIVTILLSESSYIKNIYFTYLFEVSDLLYIEYSKREIILDHLFTLIPRKGDTFGFLDYFRSIGSYVPTSKLGEAIDPLVKLVLSDDEEKQKNGYELIFQEFRLLTEKSDEIVRKRLQDWEISLSNREGHQSQTSRLEDLIAAYELPF